MVVSHVVADLVAAVVPVVHAILAIARDVVAATLAVVRDVVAALVASVRSLIAAVANAVLTIGRAIASNGAVTAAILNSRSCLGALGQIQKAAQIALRRFERRAPATGARPTSAGATGVGTS